LKKSFYLCGSQSLLRIHTDYNSQKYPNQEIYANQSAGKAYRKDTSGISRRDTQDIDDPIGESQLRGKKSDSAAIVVMY